MKIITIVGCCTSGIRKSVMINECWTTKINHRNTFSPYILLYMYFRTGGEDEGG